MRKHGWQLPYHPLQVVAVSVFLALGFAFYVFFAPFVGRKVHQYIVMGIYTPLIICAFGLYIWCTGADPVDRGVFKSKKYLKTSKTKPDVINKESKPDSRTEAYKPPSCFMALSALIPRAFICRCSNPNEESSELRIGEDGMFYCSLCEVEVFKYSKHCRVCDKCVDQFDHHCRWLNNCVGKRNYRKFFALMVSALLLLVLQWSSGIFILIRSFLEHKRLIVDVATKLGSSFSLASYITVLAVCTLLAMIATLPLVQLFFFHILLIKKGISTYDYIIALREQELQETERQQSPQMSPASSLTALSSASSFNTFRQGAWCTPPRLFVDNQYDVVPPDTSSVSSLGKKAVNDPPKKKNPSIVKISPWTLARLNTEEVSKAAAAARKKSKILQPVSREKTEPMGPYGLARGSRRMFSRFDENRRRGSKRIHLSERLQPPTNQISNMGNDRMAGGNLSNGIVGSSPDSRLESPEIHPFRASSSGAESPEIHPFRVSSLGAEDARKPTNIVVSGAHENQRIVQLSRSMSDGYDASGGEDSDWVPSRMVQRSGNWSTNVFGADQDKRIARARLKMPSFSYPNDRNI